ncbi:MAG: phosphoribosylglycinamide formyltransferase [Gammaproteobacteria bacterium]|nr:phosphoribosylglycinamide formyltransferase [Gammaproteobacteria bacterium]
MNAATSPFPIVILISGRGSNLQAIIDAVANNKLPVEIRAVISNRPAADGLQRATLAGIPTAVIDHSLYPDRAAFDQALLECIERLQPGLVVLAGFMRILTAGFVQHYQGRMLNVHPSLLPDFPGLHTHRQALVSGCQQHGASIHFVTEAVDGGPVVLQAQVPVYQQDTVTTLAARVLEQEHRLYPLAIRWFAEQRLRLDSAGHAVFDGKILSEPVILTQESGT